MMKDFVENLRRKLNDPLPGIEIQYEMAPVNRAKYKLEELTKNQYRKSAVMILLYPENGEFWVPLTKRHDYEGKHSGQISFPGGKYDPEDIDLSHTAIRELDEELGVFGNIEIIGKLTPVFIPVSGFLVEPFVSIYSGDDRITFNPNEREVKEIIPFSVNALSNGLIPKKTGTVQNGDFKIKTPYFEIEGHQVWGATSMMLNEFKNLIS